MPEITADMLSPGEEVEVSGFRVRLHYDLDPAPPWDGTDAVVPVLIGAPAGDGVEWRQIGCESTDLRLDALSIVSNSVIEENAGALLRWLGGSEQELSEFLEENEGLYESRAESLQDYLMTLMAESAPDSRTAYHRPLQQAHDYANCLEGVLRSIGIPADAFRMGFQDGGAEVYVVALTPEWCREAGFETLQWNSENWEETPDETKERLRLEVEQFKETYLGWRNGTILAVEVFDSGGESVAWCDGLYSREVAAEFASTAIAEAAREADAGTPEP